MRAALDRGIASVSKGGASIRCTSEPETLAFSCVEQLDQDHFAALDVVAEPIAPNDHRTGRRPVQATDPIIGPGGGGGRYSVTTTDGAYAIHATEFQRLLRGAGPKLPSATQVLEVISATYNGKPANR